MKLSKTLNLFLSVVMLSGSSLALAAKPMACTKLFSDAIAKKNKVERPKEALPVEINDADSFAEAITKGMLLNANQGDLFGIYLAMYFGDPKTDLAGNSFATVQQILKQHPELEKTHFPEYEISKVVKIYESSENLTQYIRGQLSAVGQMRSNLFQIEANLGFWKKLLDYKDLKAVEGSTKETQKEISEKNKARFLKYLSKVISPENRQLLKDDKTEYEVKIVVLFKTLEQLRIHFEKNKKDSKFIRQTMVDLVHTTGYLNLTTISLLKGEDALQRIEGLNKIIDERESMAMRLGFNGHFSELLQNLDIAYPSLTGVPEANTAKIISSLEQEIKKGKFTTKTIDNIRVRSLSIQEAGFRSCLGGSDCSSRTYFSKAFDPNYHYFTMTDKQNKSSGHATVVLGTALDAKGKTVKVAFLDKLQNVPDQLIIEFLQAVQKSLKEKDYKLGIPEDLEAHNGLSNMPNTYSYVKQYVMPNLSVVLTGFTPQAHSYSFPNTYSRAYAKLTMRIFDMKPETLENTEIRPGVFYKPYAADSTLSKQALVAKFLQLKDSSNPDEIMQYITGIRTVEFLQKQGLLSKQKFLNDLKKIFETSTYSFKIRKTAWLEYRQNVEPSIEKNYLLHELRLFSDSDRPTLIKEIRDWGNSTNKDRQKFSQKFFKDFADVAFNRARDRRNWELAIADLKFMFGNRLIDSNIKDINGNTLFHYAAMGRAVETAQFLATIPGIKLNEKNNDGRCAIHQGWDETYTVAQLMKIPGVDVNAKDSYGLTVLSSWVANPNHYPKNADRVKFLLELPGIDKNTKDNYGASVLLNAINDHEVLKLFLAEAGVDFNVVDDEGHNLLQIARLEKDDELFTLLLKAPGIKVDQESNIYRERMIFKISRSSADKSEKFQTILNIFNISEINNTVPPETAELLFFYAVALGQIEPMKKLSEIQGININRVVEDKRVEFGRSAFTAIEIAVATGNTEAVEFLLRRPDLKIRNFGGYEGLLYESIRKNHFAIFEILLKLPGIQVGPWPLFRAIRSDPEGRIYLERLLQMPISDINEPIFNSFEAEKETLLIQTFKYGEVWHLKHVLKIPGIDINFKYVNESPRSTTYGRTLLYRLISNLRRDTAKVIAYIDVLLEDPRLNLTLIDEDGNSVLMFALNRKADVGDQLVMLRKLLSKMDQQTINFVNPRTNETALSIAKKQWPEEIVDLLIAAGAHK